MRTRARKRYVVDRPTNPEDLDVPGIIYEGGRTPHEMLRAEGYTGTTVEMLQAKAKVKGWSGGVPRTSIDD